MSTKYNIYIQRCFDLARLGAGNVSPNPLVGAVISTPNKIIGEGYHIQYGKSHAEVNAVEQALKNNFKNFQNTTLFVSLEPCNFQGKTPACTDLIKHHRIPRVVVAAIDKTDKVNFAGIQNLKAHGHQVEYGILKEKGEFLARIRNTFISRKRPYIILKYAQSQDGYIGQQGKQIWISNGYTKRLVHKWRAEVKAIIVGKNTVIVDDPSLTTRLYPGKSPLRVSIDLNNEISKTAKIKNNEANSWIYTTSSAPSTDNQTFKNKIVHDSETVLRQICTDLFEEDLDTLFVEGGAALLQSFIDADLWDEARVITSPTSLDNGIAAPKLSGIRIADFKMHNDQIELLLSPKNVIYS